MKHPRARAGTAIKRPAIAADALVVAFIPNRKQRQCRVFSAENPMRSKLLARVFWVQAQMICANFETHDLGIKISRPLHIGHRKVDLAEAGNPDSTEVLFLRATQRKREKVTVGIIKIKERFSRRRLDWPFKRIFGLR